jgi:NTP pyrophosphatase (non-canonical NTP hydrolase)
MTTIAELTSLALKFRDDRDWKQFHNPKDVALSLALEAAEVLELTQWRSGDALQAHLAGHTHLLGEELSDVLCWVLILAHDQGIDLPRAFTAKMRANAEKYPVDKARGSAKKYTEYQSPASGAGG